MRITHQKSGEWLTRYQYGLDAVGNRTVITETTTAVHSYLLPALGKTSGRVGYLNKRGSLVLAKRPEIGPTYIDCGAHVLTFARLFARGLKADSEAAAAVLSAKLQRYGGDTAVYGKGEILTPA